MAEQAPDPRKDSRFQEQIPDDNKAPSTNQQVPAESNPNPEHLGVTPRQDPSPERAGQTSPGEGQAPPAHTSSTVPYTGSNLACEVCGRVICVCPPSARQANRQVPSVNTSWTLTQALSSVPSTSRTDENVSPTDKDHVKFATPVDNKKKLIRNERPQTVLAMEPDQAESQYTAALRRVNRANVALEEARARSVDAHVALRAAEANARATPGHEANAAVEIARYDASVADNAHRDAQTEAISAHAALSNANFNAQHVGSTQAIAALQPRTANQGLHSDVQKPPPQKQSSWEKDGSTRWKGKGKAEDSDSSSADRKHSLSSLYQQPMEAAKRIFHVGDFNERYPEQRLERSQSQRTLQSPNPLYKYRTPKPEPLVKRGPLPGQRRRAQPPKDRSATPTDRPASVHISSVQNGTTSGSGVADQDGTNDGNIRSSQHGKTVASGSGDSTQQGTGTIQGTGNPDPAGNGDAPPPPPPPAGGETGKRRGPLRRKVSDFLGKLKKKK